MVQWDLGRFAQTLIEFDVLPLSGSLKSLLGQQQPVASKMQLGEYLKMGQILLVGGDRPENQALASVLTQRGYLVRQLSANQLTSETVAASDIAVLCFDLAEADIKQAFEVLSSEPLWRSPSWTVFDFRQATTEMAQLWGAVDDVVMGGVSSSRFQLTPEHANFTGIVSTDNNGGFASVRTKNFASPWDVSAYRGFRLRVKGDGQRYKFIGRCEGRWDGVSYSFSFDTVADQWINVDVPFDELIPVVRAKSVPQMGGFNAQQLYAVQLMLSKFEYDGRLNPTFKPGAFNLAIAAISVYGGAAFPRVIALSAQTAMQEQLQELNLPYCLLHRPEGYSPDIFAAVTNAIGDRKKINQIIPC